MCKLSFRLCDLCAQTTKSRYHLCFGSVVFGFQARPFPCSKQDIYCLPSRTATVFQEGNLLRSRQDISHGPSSTSPVFQARHSLCFKQNISCVPGRTSSVFQAGHLLCSKQDISFATITKIAHTTFWQIRQIVPGFLRIMSQNRSNLGTIERSRQKVACECSELQTA